MQLPSAPEPTPPTPPRRSPTNLVVALALGALIVLAMVAVARRGAQTPSVKDPVPAGASRRAMIEAVDKLRASNWADFQGATKADLERRLLLLDAAIYATDAYVAAVDRLDPTVPENAAARLNRDDFANRGRLFRTGRQMVDFLREHFGRWRYDPVARSVTFANEDALFEQFAAIQTELHDVAQASKDALTSRPATSADSTPSTVPTPTRLPNVPPAAAPSSTPVDPPAAPAPP